MINADTNPEPDVATIKPPLPPLNKTVEDMFSKSLKPIIPQHIQTLIQQKISELEENLRSVYMEKVYVSNSKALDIFKNSIGQAKNKNGQWEKARAVRTTASKGWSINQARNNSTRMSNWRPKSSRNKYTDHGNRMEPKARKKLARKLAKIYPNCRLFDSGM